MDDTVLVVDDDRAIRTELARVLRGAGFVPIEAADANAALAHARAYPPIGAILDVVLPGPDGVTLLGWLKGVSPDLAVLMLTGQGDLRTAVACLTKGADAYLLKPVQEGELLAVLRRALDRRRLSLENRAYQRGLEQMVEERTAELRRATQRLEELDQLKTEFVSRVSHELRGPLTVMHTNLSVLLERLVGPLTPEQVDLLVSCQRNIDRLSRMVENVLDLSRLESGRLEISRESLDPCEVVHAAITYYQPVARERGVDLTAELDGEPTGPIWADGDKMQQVLMNLVDNALKFTPRGGRVRVSIVPEPGAVRFAVRDTGIGVPPQDRDRIFERFVQGKQLLGSKRRGAGLGLSIARSLVELHGGTFRVSNEEGGGAIFSFSIPREAAAG